MIVDILLMLLLNCVCIYIYIYICICISIDLSIYLSLHPSPWHSDDDDVWHEEAASVPLFFLPLLRNNKQNIDVISRHHHPNVLRLV